MRLDPRSKFGQRTNLLIRETSGIALRRSFDTPRTAACGCLNEKALVTQAALDDLASERSDNEVIGVDHARDNGLTQARTGVDDRLMSLAGQRVGGEEHSCDLSIDHPLDNNREIDSAMVEAQARPVAHCPLSPQRGPAMSHCREHCLDANNIQVGLLLPGKA